MKAADLQNYRDVSKRMRGFGAELATLFGSDPPVGLQMFVCRNLGSPLTDMEWATFMMNNKGNLPSEVATWERWDRLPDRTGCFRFFGTGNPSDVDEIVLAVRKGDEILAEYEDIDLAEELEWDLPNPVRWFYGCTLPDYYCLLELICRESGKCGNDDGINVDGLKTYPDPLEGYWGEPSPLESVGLEMRVVDSLTSATAQAVESWIPPGVDYLDITVEKPVPRPVPTVRTITVKKGVEGYYLEGNDGRVIHIPPCDCEWVMRVFFHKVAHNASGEVVSWAALNLLLDQEANSKQASAAVRKLILSLRRRLGKWGQPPDGDEWIITDKGIGCRLNASCVWQIEKGAKRELGRGSPSVYPDSLDPHTAAKNTAARGEVA